MRKELDLSQRVLGELIGVSRDIISDMELGRARPFADVYLKIVALHKKMSRIKRKTPPAAAKTSLPNSSS